MDPKEALARIAAAVDANAHHPAGDVYGKSDDGKPVVSYGLTEVFADDVIAVGGAIKDDRVQALVSGARGALEGRRKDAPPLVVAQKTHELARLVESATEPK